MISNRPRQSLCADGLSKDTGPGGADVGQEPERTEPDQAEVSEDPVLLRAPLNVHYLVHVRGVTWSFLDFTQASAPPSLPPAPPYHSMRRIR